ncbi:MAG: nuclear transport factor 2 family protein [Betaproteobacteria bacterium]|nr:nuclear transport factor 2 family protein [Betaproteobacteria bacterium]
MALSAADKLEIMELVSRYNWAIDHDHAEEWVDLFTADGRFLIDGEVRGEGCDNLLAYTRKSAAAGNKKRHWTSNALIEGDGDRARLRLYIMALDISEGIRPYIMGEYDDTLARVDGRWKFRERNVTLCAGKSWLQGALKK